MLQDLPVLIEGYTVLLTEDPMPKFRKDRESGKLVPSTDREGNPLFVAAVFVKPPKDQAGRFGKGLEVKVTLETDPGEVFEAGGFVELVNPRISQWEIDGKSGVSWKASALKPATRRKASTSAAA